MGLTATAYSNLRKLDVVFDIDGVPLDARTHEYIEGDYVKFYINDDFQHRADDIEYRCVYEFDDSYLCWGRGYGAYYNFRELLAQLAGYPLLEYVNHFSKQLTKSHQAGAWAAVSGPFYELINFSDCEGTLGTDTCKKLANDFIEWEAKILQRTDGSFDDQYLRWERGLIMASHGGAIKFS